MEASALRLKCGRAGLEHMKPDALGYVVYCAPSSDDMAFASQWKSIGLELAAKMRFFVIKGQDVCEYSLPQGRVNPWRVFNSPETTVVADRTKSSAEMAQEGQPGLSETDEAGHPLQKQPEPQSEAPHHPDISTILSFVGWLFLALVIIYGLLSSL
jgi:hypothetical protein